MTMCGRCSGTGKVTCIGCGGKGSKSRFTMKGEVETTTCLVCGGQRRTRCDFCGGRGTIGSSTPGAPPAPRPRGKNEDVLAGRWNAQGGWYEFEKDGADYRFTEYGALGTTGGGTATIAGNRVILDITNMVLGRFTVELRLQGDTMQGTLNVIGMGMPFVLTRG